MLAATVVNEISKPKMKAPVVLACVVTAMCIHNPLSAQPRAILADGGGPWRNAQWVFAASEFSGLLKDAGYSVQVVSPVDLPSALSGTDILLAVPSLESLPVDTFMAIAGHVGAGVAWGFTAPVDGSGQLTNPLDEQISPPIAATGPAGNRSTGPRQLRFARGAGGDLRHHDAPGSR
jgi:hypothetical protein